jgi:hypothetical protein
VVDNAYTTVLDFTGDIKVSDVYMSGSLRTRRLSVVFELDGAGIVLLDDGLATNLL